MDIPEPVSDWSQAVLIAHVQMGRVVGPCMTWPQLFLRRSSVTASMKFHRSGASFSLVFWIFASNHLWIGSADDIALVVIQWFRQSRLSGALAKWAFRIGTTVAGSNRLGSDDVNPQLSRSRSIAGWQSSIWPPEIQISFVIAGWTKSDHLPRRGSHGDDRRLVANTTVKLVGPRNAVSIFGIRIKTGA